MILGEDPRWPYARQYIERGWPIFVLGQKKTPLPNCDACARADWTHDREACECLTCHGFYAATTYEVRIREMMKLHPHGLLALRCGKKSGVLVLDFEATAEPGEPSGLQVAESWNEWANVEWHLPPTLKAQTASGGMHLFYRYPEGLHIPMRNRILPSTDLKGEHGYVALPCGLDDRKWFNWYNSPMGRGVLATLPAEAVSWLRNIRGRRTGRSSDVQTERPQGYSFLECIARGPRHGERDEFWNDFIFRARKARREAEDVREACWQLWEQWQLGEGSDPFPFEWIEYKIDRVWSTVAPDAINERQRMWADAMGKVQAPPTTGPFHLEVGGEVEGDGTVKIGYATLRKQERKYYSS